MLYISHLIERERSLIATRITLFESSWKIATFLEMMRLHAATYTGMRYYTHPYISEKRSRAYKVMILFKFLIIMMIVVIIIIRRRWWWCEKIYSRRSAYRFFSIFASAELMHCTYVHIIDILLHYDAIFFIFFLKCLCQGYFRKNLCESCWVSNVCYTFFFYSNRKCEFSENYFQFVLKFSKMFCNFSRYL